MKTLSECLSMPGIHIDWCIMDAARINDDGCPVETYIQVHVYNIAKLSLRVLPMSLCSTKDRSYDDIFGSTE